jgi:hypothetical protein
MVVVYSMRDSRLCNQPTPGSIGLRCFRGSAARAVNLPRTARRPARCAVTNGPRLSQLGFVAQGGVSCFTPISLGVLAIALDIVVHNSWLHAATGALMVASRLALDLEWDVGRSDPRWMGSIAAVSA